MNAKKKMSKQLGVSFVIVICLAVYLLISTRGQNDVPKLKAWSGKADYILIQKGETSLYFQNTGGDWFINDEKYPADENAVINFVERIEKLRLTDLISDQPFYERFGLEPSNEMIVTVKNNDKVLRKISIGNTASTGRHSFIRINDKPEVYQTDTVFYSEHDMNLQEYRDKNICKIKEGDIISAAVTYNGKTFTFNKGFDRSGETAEGDVWVCQEFADVVLNQNKVNQLVFAIAGLRAFDFAEPPVVLSNTSVKTASLLIKSKDAEAELTILPYKAASKSEEKMYAVISSKDAYQFIVEERQAKKFFVENISEYAESENK